MEVARRPSGYVPITATSTSAYPLQTSGTAWVDLDNGGSAAARPLDIVIPGLRNGDSVEFGFNSLSFAAANAQYARVATIVSGAVVNAHEALGWAALNNTVSAMNGSIILPVVSGDIENGSVRLRIQYQRVTGTASRSIGVDTMPTRTWGRGPFR